MAAMTSPSPPSGPWTIAHVDAETGFSGGEVQVFLLMEGLRARGHRSVLIAPPGSRALDEARARGFDTRAVSMANDVDVVAVARLARAYASCHADLAHLHTGRATWLGGWGARWCGLPAVTTRRMDRRVRPGWRTQTIYERLTGAVGAISPGVVRCLEAGGVPAERIELIPSAVDAERLRPVRDRSDVRAELGTEDGAIVFVALGALVRRKGLDVLLDAVARLDLEPPWALWIAGDGPEREDLARRIAALGAPLGRRVRLLGQRADVGDLLAAADALVLPSRAEGLGVAALEAMAAGRPVVATSVGGLGDAVVDGETGLVVPPDDPDRLAGALARLLRDPELGARLGRGGPARIAERFSPAAMVDAYVKLYARVLAGPGTAAER